MTWAVLFRQSRTWGEVGEQVAASVCETTGNDERGADGSRETTGQDGSHPEACEAVGVSAKSVNRSKEGRYSPLLLYSWSRVEHVLIVNKALNNDGDEFHVGEVLAGVSLTIATTFRLASKGQRSHHFPFLHFYNELQI